MWSQRSKGRLPSLQNINVQTLFNVERITMASFCTTDLSPLTYFLIQTIGGFITYDNEGLFVQTENTNRRGKYHHTADHLFVLFGFSCFVYIEWVTVLLVCLKPNQLKRRSTVPTMILPPVVSVLYLVQTNHSIYSLTFDHDSCPTQLNIASHLYLVSA